ncbi:probable E3 ubiquitin-protein ligase ARI7 isoform X1 [Ananas comosus]|uniref:RBR-type E3 ubiquitin transferase n=2 Tax=Ananas comosus TaxID=4615 RepID=A0A6P5EXK6_ANACO|nr:probable E3 ubiquitin-protein ligase ARI7 isoform X1 [Ananas comosus]CAD1838981.1 unnamed protein product [Ananas comosus var. bracteatus]
MESEEDMHDANDWESVGEDLYSDYGEEGSEVYVEEGDDFFCNSNFDDSKDVMVVREKPFTVLSEDDIRQRQEEDISKTVAILSISKAEAFILLRHFKWDENRVNDEWFANEVAVRRAIGLLENRVEIPKLMELSIDHLTCGICFETYPPNMMSAAACGHRFCGACWQGYIGTSISNGPGCLTLRCPDPSCSAAILQDMINFLATDEDKEKYARFYFRSYVEDGRKIKWCPAPGCDFAVEYYKGSANYDVSCSCSFSFCWNCTEEAHRPVDCSTVAKWILKNSAESENMNWILANSKPCPKCKRPIEKNQGCMHMTCTPPCKFEFCWLCLGVWSEHGERTGGFYACNRYESAKKEGVYDEAERRREMAKNCLERYTHYYERWASNQTSRQKAFADLQSMRNEKIAKLREIIKEEESQLSFVIDAWSQIVECRRVLKWTYAYGYYLPDHELARKHFFEYLQGEAESGLERLHQCAEKELQVFFDALPDSPPTKEFCAFKTKLAGLTAVTRTYFENLVQALENGLEDVSSASQVAGSSTSKSQSTKGKAGKNKAAKLAVPQISPDDYWACDRCTFNNHPSAKRCEMCSHHQ